MELTQVRASRVGALFGVDPRCTKLVLYHELRGEIGESEDTEAMMEGRHMEAAIAAIAAEKFGWQVEPVPERLRELRAGYVSGHPDRVIRLPDGKLAILEIKHTFQGGGGDWSDGLPGHYFFQAHTYGWLLREAIGDEAADTVYVAARLYGGTTPFEVRLDAELWAETQRRAGALLAAAKAGEPPMPTTEDDHRIRWLANNERVAEGGPEQEGWIKKLLELGKVRREAEAAETELRQLLLGWAQDAGVVTLRSPDGVAIEAVSLRANKEFDQEAFLAEHPETAARYQRLDLTALRKANPKLYAQFQRLPTSPVEQKRVIRLSTKLDWL